MHNPITLIVKDRRGNTLDLFDIDPSAATPLTIDATAGAYYVPPVQATRCASPSATTPTSSSPTISVAARVRSLACKQAVGCSVTRSTSRRNTALPLK